MIGALSAPVVVIVAGLVFGGTQGDLELRERRLLWLAFVMHVGAALLQVWITTGYYGGGDMLLYSSTGSLIARWIDIDPRSAWPETLNLLIQRPAHFPFPVIGAGSSTGSMAAVSGLLQLVLGPSLYASCLAVASVSFAGKVALYRAFRETYPAALRTHLALAAAGVPSLVFWSSGLLKESLAVAGLGFVVFGFHRARRGRVVFGAALALVGAALVSISKPYVLFAFVIAAAVWVYWERAIHKSGGKAVELRPLTLALGLLGAWVGLVLLGQAFPRYSVEALPEEASRLQGLGRIIVGGSNYSVGVGSSTSPGEQLAFAPVALLTAIFRPTLLEARNVALFVGASETTALVLICLRTLATKSLGRLWGETRASAPAMMSLAFVIVFGTAVGLMSTNLGTLSRYRVPMLPFLASVVLLLSRPERDRVRDSGASMDRARASSREPLLGPTGAGN